MRYPPEIAALALPVNRPKLWMSIRSGYATVAAFALLAVVARQLHMVERPAPLYALVALKLVTNTLSLISLRKETLILEAGGLNVTVDLACMTGAIYFTGGLESPLFSIYAIEITVVALLTNLRVTLMVAGGAVAMYGAMGALIHAGVLPATPTPVEIAGHRSLSYVLLSIGYASFVLGVPTFYTASILRILRDKERALQAHADALVEAGKQKSQFMANITHELRTPIHGICGLSDLVESGIYGSITEKQREAHQGIKRSARSLLQLIDDLLALARADAGKSAVELGEVSLSELLPPLVATIRWMAGTKPIVVDLELEDGLPTLVTDRAKLNQILINLLGNAVKFTQDGGHVTVRARMVDGSVMVEVEDDGIGISPAELPRLFEPFQQGDGSPERAFGGVGLGLSLVKELCEMLGGGVTVETTSGEGSVFRVTLPLVTSPGAARRTARHVMS